jgi:hypothetical protein
VIPSHFALLSFCFRFAIALRSLGDALLRHHEMSCNHFPNFTRSLCNCLAIA